MQDTASDMEGKRDKLAQKVLSLISRYKQLLVSLLLQNISSARIGLTSSKKCVCKGLRIPRGYKRTTKLKNNLDYSLTAKRCLRPCTRHQFV